MYLLTSLQQLEHDISNIRWAMNVLLSGLIAAIISGLINFYGNWRATKTQKEIAKMQKDERLFYESQLDWTNETRKLIAKFVNDCFKYNILVTNINNMNKKVVEEKNFTLDEKEKLLRENADNVQKAANLFTALNNDETMIKLFLFHNDNEDEQRIIQMVENIENNLDTHKGVDSKLLDKFVDVARDYFDHQMKELKEKSA